MYNTLAKNYDRFVNWESRLSFEMPFIEKQIDLLRSSPGAPQRILDAACGSGMHAIALAQQGHVVSGADLVPQMIRVSRHNARAAGASVEFKTAGFGQLAQVFGSGTFDLLLCLGNSLPHLTTEQDLSAALADFAACLRTGGMLLIQNRNFDAVMAARNRWMEPQAFREGDHEWLFQRYYDFEPDGLIRLIIVTLTRQAGQDWNSSISSTLLRPQLQDELTSGLAAAGFTSMKAYGSMQGEVFEKATSGNLILTAIKQ